MLAYEGFFGQLQMTPNIYQISRTALDIRHSIIKAFIILPLPRTHIACARFTEDVAVEVILWG